MSEERTRMLEDRIGVILAARDVALWHSFWLARDQARASSEQSKVIDEELDKIRLLVDAIDGFFKKPRRDHVSEFNDLMPVRHVVSVVLNDAELGSLALMLQHFNLDRSPGLQALLREVTQERP